MKIVIDKDRKLVRLESDEFMIKFNGKSNSDYKVILKPLGIDLVFESGVDAAEETDTVAAINEAEPS
jgi:hypothetical protein